MNAGARKFDRGSVGREARWARMLVAGVDALLERFEGSRDYPFVDTKFDLVTGEDFPDGPDPVRGRGTIYGWVQGRGLEALATHAVWLEDEARGLGIDPGDRPARLRAMVSAVMESMESWREAQGGRLSFMMERGGGAFDLDEQGRRRPLGSPAGAGHFTDLFYAKGLMAAASLLGREREAAGARDLLRRVLSALKAGRFVSDQVPLDPRNPVRPVPGRHPQGPWMIAIGAASLFASLSGEEEWLDAGLDLIRRLLDTHVNGGRDPRMDPWAFAEFIGDDGRPWMSEGAIPCDPGHALEFVGLACKHLALCGAKRRGADFAGVLDRCRTALPGILLSAFEKGFVPQPGGIVKFFDLLTGRPLNPDMPWWNLPETLRAAAGVRLLFPGEAGATLCPGIIDQCAGAFWSNFVNPRVHSMAIQTLAPDGTVSTAIPAVPDADPCYHTGLSIIDFLRWNTRHPLRPAPET